MKSWIALGALGLDAGVNYRQNPDWAAWAQEQTGGEGVDLVIEVGGAGTFNQSLKAVRIGGAVAQIGVLSDSDDPVSVSQILRKQVHLQGIYVGSRSDFARAQPGFGDRPHSACDRPRVPLSTSCPKPCGLWSLLRTSASWWYTCSEVAGRLRQGQPGSVRASAAIQP